MSIKLSYVINVEAEAAKMDKLEGQIFLEVAEGLVIDNLASRFILSQLKAYCKNMATYERLMAMVPNDFMVPGQRTDIVDPKMNQALSFLRAAMDIATRNGLTLKSRKQIGEGQPRTEQENGEFD